MKFRWRMENVQENKCLSLCTSRIGQGNGSTARSLEEIPQKYRHIFHDYKKFNLVQSKVLDDVLRTNKSIIISAPTGSGKTAIFELAIIQFLMNQQEGSNSKIVYVAPIKALCSERYLDWSKKFASLGVSCREATGDTDFGDLSELEHTSLVITTPEKWDSLTRKWRDYDDLFGSISLFLIDEVHLLSEDIRGPILETIVSRMKTIQFSMNLKKKTGNSLRFIAASATIPNIEDLATWLGRRSEYSVSYFRISDENRPVPLEKYILGFNSNSGGFKFDMSLNYKLAGIIRKYSTGKPTLIFCSSRKSVEMASTELFKSSPVVLSDNRKVALIALSKRLQDSKLQNLVLKGISYHHAGLGHDDRNIIEEAFRISLLLILVSTSTLAMGVNLPAHLVIIKSTATFIRGSAEEYKESALLQMIGRAGRPQYDTKGVAVIMTELKNVKKYENLMNGRTPVESHLHKHLAEHLNSEIVLQTITDLEVAMEWIRSTFLYVRAVKSPVTYGFAAGMTRETVEKKLEEICLLQLNALETQGLIVKDPTFGMSVLATQFGRLMARYYLSFDTMKVFRKIRGDETFLEMFNTIISCNEFKDFTLRVSDKKTLNNLNSTCIKFPIKGKIKSAHDKISCLIQAVLNNVPVQESSLTLDALKMIRLGERIAKCLVEYIRLSYKNSNTKTYQALLNSVIISKCLKARMWQDSEFVCKQLKKIGTVFSNCLIKAGKTTIKSLEETSTGALEMILGKPPPFGNEIHQGLAAFPEYELILKREGSESIQIIIKQIKNTFKYEGKNSILIIGDSENNLILFHETIDAVISDFGVFEKNLKIPNMSAYSIEANLVHECLVGVDKSTTLILNYIEPANNSTTDNKDNKRDKTTSKVTRSKSNNKPKKASKTVRKTATSKTTILEQHEELFENEDYFKNIDEMDALYEGRSNLNSNNIHKADKKTFPQKLNSFNNTESPNLNLSAINKDELLEMFDDDFDDSMMVLGDDTNNENIVPNEENVVFTAEDFSEEFNLPSNQEGLIANNLKNSEKKQKLISDFFLKRKYVNNSAPEREKIKKKSPPKKNFEINCLNKNINSNNGTITSQREIPNLFQGKKNEKRCIESQIGVQNSMRETNKVLINNDNWAEQQSETFKAFNLNISSTVENNVDSAQQKFPVSRDVNYTSTGNKEHIALNQKPHKTLESDNMALNMVFDHMSDIEPSTQPLNLCAREINPVDLSKQHSPNQEKAIPLIKEKEISLIKGTYNLNDSKEIPKHYELEKVFKLPPLLQLPRSESLLECSLPKQRCLITEEGVSNNSNTLIKSNFEENFFNFDHPKVEELTRWNFNSYIFGDAKNGTNINCYEENDFFSSQNVKKENLLKSVTETSCKNKLIKEIWKRQSFSEWLFCDNQENSLKSSICHSVVSGKENIPLTPLFDKGGDNQIRKVLPIKPVNIFGPVNHLSVKSKFFKSKSNFDIQKDNILKMNELVHHKPVKRTIKEKLNYNQRFKGPDENLLEENLHENNSFKHFEYGRMENQTNWNNCDADRTVFTKKTAVEQKDEGISSKIYNTNLSIDKIAIMIIKQQKSRTILDILQVIVDSKLSKKVKTPLTLNDLSINYSNESQESVNFLKPKDTNFLTENDEDKKYIYTNSAKSHRKPTSGSIVRLPEVKRGKSNNDDIKQNPAKGLLSICLKPLTRPHNLYKSKIMRRQKAFLVPKTKQCDRINLGKSISELFSSSYSREFKNILNGVETTTEQEQQVKELHNELDFEIDSISDLFEEDKLENNMYYRSAEDFTGELQAHSTFSKSPFFEEQSTPFEDGPISEDSGSSRRYDDFFSSFSQRSGQVYEHFIDEF